MKNILLLLTILLVAGALGFAAFTLLQESDTEEVSRVDPGLGADATVPQTVQNDTVIAEEIVVEELKYSIDEPDSLWVVVNRDRPISKLYVPENLVDVNVVKREDKSKAELQLRSDAARALEQLFAAAAESDLELLLSSAYRSAELQEFYYTNYVAAYGQEEADTFSAVPGTSEHQIGLSADIHSVSQECYLEICFGSTTEGRWLAQNAHLYGYVIRYPEGKEAITTYQYEPWHFRYVGQELAADLFAEQTTLEEYFEL